MSNIKDIIDTVAPAFADLGLLSDADLARARKLVTEAGRYRTLTVNAEQAVTTRIAGVADKLTASKSLTPEMVIDAAVGIPDAAVVAEVAGHVERSLNREARDLVLVRAGEVVPLLNTRLVEIADETATLAGELANIHSPQAAIDLDKVSAWRRGQELIAEYAVISDLVRELRELRIIPAPTGATSGAIWRILRDEDRSTWLPKDPTPWQVHVRSMSRRPWVPASVEQAKAVAADWANAGVPA